MADRQATVLVADEIYFNLFGKAILQGIYHNDLGIAADPTPTPQLVFFFIAETDASDPFLSFAVEATLPGSAPVRTAVALPPAAFVVAANPGKTRLSYRQPLLLPAPVLRPGEIKAKLIHEKGEITVTAPWIIHNQPPKLSS
jgi:hypothetical protein